MTAKHKYLIVDAGNTRIKVAHYQDEKLLKLVLLSNANFVDFPKRVQEFSYDFAILSSVRSQKDSEMMLDALANCHVLGPKSKLPLSMAYETPQTLGADRLANAAAIAQNAAGAALSIDVGTCIKFDFVDAAKTYQGGSISPGIALRYRSLHDYTAALPLLDEKTIPALIGKQTSGSITSGVLNGIQGEIDYFIKMYSESYPDLTIFVTGGDARYFDYSAKKNIFADENLTLLGLLLILKANAE